jgi:redox-regulated HSP33 family molecular chaperone
MTVGDLETWVDEDHGVEYRCYYCSGRHAADRDRD